MFWHVHLESRQRFMSAAMTPNGAQLSGTTAATPSPKDAGGTEVA
jgi:hypothetical protein